MAADRSGSQGSSRAATRHARSATGLGRVTGYIRWLFLTESPSSGKIQTDLSAIQGGVFGITTSFPNSLQTQVDFESPLGFY